MSARFGHDFSRVRIHTDTRATQAAQGIGAHAFTIGNDIVFGSAQYSPGSSTGERLLAHELTHVAQQAQFGPGSDTAGLSRRGDAAEREAETAADQALAGHAVTVQARPTAGIHRLELPGGYEFDTEGAGHWFNTVKSDAKTTARHGIESLPGVGNMFSAASAVRDLSGAGIAELRGDDKEATRRLYNAEDNGLNAIPGWGNARAQEEAKTDFAALKGDFIGNSRLSSEESWQASGARDFNSKVGSMFDGLFD